MSHFEITRRLSVSRTLSDGTLVTVGTLAQNADGIYFGYDAAYLNQYGNLSPYRLRADTELQLAPRQPHNGLHGLFADSLPDGWGLLLQDRYFRSIGRDGFVCFHSHAPKCGHRPSCGNHNATHTRIKNIALPHSRAAYILPAITRTSIR